MDIVMLIMKVLSNGQLGQKLKNNSTKVILRFDNVIMEGWCQDFNALDWMVYIGTSDYTIFHINNSMLNGSVSWIRW